MKNIIKLQSGKVLIDDLGSNDKDVILEEDAILEKTETGVQVKGAHQSSVYHISLEEVNSIVRLDGSITNPLTVTGLFVELFNNIFVRVSVLTANDLTISAGTEGANISAINKFGEFGGIAKTTTGDDIWDGGGIYEPPTTDRAHTIVSDSIEDIGVLTSSGTVTSDSTTEIVDTSAAFISDGVSIGNVVLNDTAQNNSIVVSVDSETQLTIRVVHNKSNAVGDSYRIVSKTGDGVATIHIDLGRQEDGTKVEEYIILNGTTPVNLINTYYRVSSMHAHGAGSNSSNVGTIQLTAAVDATVTAQINPDNGRTLMAFYHIPIGFTGFMTNYCVTMFRSVQALGAMGRVQLKSRLWGNGNDGVITEHSVGLSIDGGEVGHKFLPFKRFDQGTDLWIRCIEASDDNTDINACFDIILVNNNFL